MFRAKINRLEFEINDISILLICNNARYEIFIKVSNKVNWPESIVKLKIV